MRDPHAIRALFAERLAALGDELDPGFGFDLARLSVLAAEPWPPEQIGLGDGENTAEFDASSTGWARGLAAAASAD